MLHSRYVQWFCGAWAVVGLLAAGCGVQEDRTIEFSPDGKSVAFQHGRDGVFINEDGQLKELVAHDEGVVARSTPLWSPDGERVVFQTAQLAGAHQDRDPALQDWNDAVEGRAYLAEQAVYTCWVYHKSVDCEPRKVFTAEAPHVGLIAANLAVRWSGDGARLIFSDATKNGMTELFEWDIATGERRKWDVPAAREIVFDVNPRSGDVVAVAVRGGEGAFDVELDYLNAQGTKRWTKRLAGQQSDVDPSTQINFLRQLKPVWSPNGDRFAFVLPPPPLMSGEHQLQVCDLKGESIAVWRQSTDGMRDIAWAPDGARLAVLADSGDLWIGSAPSAMKQYTGIEELRRFAGWNFDGQFVAGVSVVAAPHMKLREDEVLPGVAFMRLLVPSPTIGDAVYLADGETFENSRPVFDGMTVTFPKWSPTASELSLWLTFTPRYVSLPGMLLGGGLRPGDPAAKLEVQTGRLEWMAVNAFEFVQIGHYYAMRGEYELAIEWYEKARQDAGPPEPPENLEEFQQVLAGRRNFSAYEALVLGVLGRDDEAAKRLAEFEAAFFPLVAEVKDAEDTAIANLLGEPGSLVQTLLREACLAEAALNLDLAGPSAELFRSRLAAAKTDSARLASMAVISQLLLFADAKREYLAFISDEFIPALENSGFSLSPAAAANGLDAAMGPLVVGLAAVPLCHAEFFAGFGQDDLRQLAAEWESAGERSTTPTGRALLDCGLASMYGQLGNDEPRQQVLARLEASPLRINGATVHQGLVRESERLVPELRLLGREP